MPFVQSGFSYEYHWGDTYVAILLGLFSYFSLPYLWRFLATLYAIAFHVGSGNPLTTVSPSPNIPSSGINIKVYDSAHREYLIPLHCGRDHSIGSSFRTDGPQLLQAGEEKPTKEART